MDWIGILSEARCQSCDKCGFDGGSPLVRGQQGREGRIGGATGDCVDCKGPSSYLVTSNYGVDRSSKFRRFRPRVFAFTLCICTQSLAVGVVRAGINSFVVRTCSRKQIWLSPE